MRDPFKPNSNRQLVREAQFGFTVIGLLVATLIYVAWFRISGQNERTPAHVRNSPIAMQVYPNSPNYDRTTHRMTSEEIPSFVASPTQTQNAANPALASASALSAPKRILEDSNRTARSLREASESIEQSANKVATLSITPKTRKQFDLVSNPATRKAADLGFKPPIKPLKMPIAIEESKKVPPANRFAAADNPRSTNSFPALNRNPAKDNPSTLLEPPKLEQPKISAPEILQKSETLLPTPNTFQPKPKSFLPKPKSDSTTAEPSTKFNPNAFKPLATTSILSSKPIKLEPNETRSSVPGPLTKPNPFKKPTQTEASDNTPTDVIPRLPKLPEQSFLNLRDGNNKTVEVKPEPVVEFAAEVPTVKTVSFEQATWTVKESDSFWSIAQSHYGDGRFFRALYEQNRKLVPGFENLTSGIEIELPPVSELVRRFPTLCPSDALRKNDQWRETPNDLMEDLTDACEADLNQRLYVTKANDTLFGIARRKLGQASRYVELIELNQYLVDTKMTHDSELPTGIQLLLPDK